MGRGPIGKKKFWVFQVGFFSGFSGFSVIILAVLQWILGLKRKNSRWLKLAFQSKIQLCVLPKFGENHHFRSGVVFTPEVRMEHGDRRWKAYPVGNKEESPNFECGAAKY